METFYIKGSCRNEWISNIWDLYPISITSPHMSIDVAAHFTRYQMDWRKRRRGDDPSMRLLLTHPRLCCQPSFVQHQPSFMSTCPHSCSAHSCLWVPTVIHLCLPHLYPPACLLALIHVEPFVCAHSLGPHLCLPLFVPTCILTCPHSCSCLPTLIGPCWWFLFVQSRATHGRVGSSQGLSNFLEDKFD